MSTSAPTAGTGPAEPVPGWSVPRPLRLAAIVPALLLAACSGAAEVAEPATGQLSARIEGADGAVLRVVLRNDGPSPVSVRTLQLRGGGFVQVPPAASTAVLVPGVEVVQDVAVGPVLCDGRPAPVAVVLEGADGPVDLPVADDAVLPALRADQCRTPPS